ncbi:hypothetical protein NDU88_011757 [Pleurodeles waltl]|uniref:Uncharacterized protein n=1 Tax=Pleurodeles waltl TaxID=8319 RepID=A0AAV7QYM5_PLEWA|nr:hypothetical protein NDU88_011757 [Pleurodeles waltl]
MLLRTLDWRGCSSTQLLAPEGRGHQGKGRARVAPLRRKPFDSRSESRCGEARTRPDECMRVGRLPRGNRHKAVNDFSACRASDSEAGPCGNQLDIRNVLTTAANWRASPQNEA